MEKEEVAVTKGEFAEAEEVTEAEEEIYRNKAEDEVIET